ncbi:MAG: phosphoglucosamine mutase [Synergistaceae bacterium]|jgi:phosphoglucosamine mutase|nr:phosphoglucosamine mutase [Synergistaceae bacterium]
MVSVSSRDVANGDKRVLFGTDGVRDVANKGEMTPEMALRLGRAFILFLAERGIPRPRIVVGRDTRRSGTMLEGALSAGMTSAGAEVLSIGVIPTPGVSFAVQRIESDGGAVISASHNPAEYNGIKFLNREGCKLSDEAEISIEEYLGDNLTDDWRPTGASVGEIRPVPHFVRRYAEHLASLVEHRELLPSSVMFDCAHGAAGAVMPFLIECLGVVWSLTGVAPDGLNINEGVGVVHIQHLSDQVTGRGCKMGFACDGDADRVLTVDSAGRLIDGDIAIWLLARWLASRGDLGSGVVVTVMSNMALEEHLSREGIQVFRCPVGDRYVLEAMRRHGARLGGEQSGHIIADSFTRTGDGLCTALMLLSALRDLNENLDTLAGRFGRYPQRLSNLRIAENHVIDMDFVRSISEEVEKRMGRNGRIVIRPSGTEPLLRILVEARDREMVEEISELLTSALRGSAVPEGRRD